jgi:hypothetical protein
VRPGPPRGKAWERICFFVAALALLGAAQAFRSAGFGEDCLAGLATAAAFACAGGFLRHGRRIAEFKLGHPGWPEFDFVRRRRK